MTVGRSTLILNQAKHFIKSKISSQIRFKTSSRHNLWLWHHSYVLSEIVSLKTVQ